MPDPVPAEAAVVDHLHQIGATLRFRKSGRVHTVDLAALPGIDDRVVAGLRPLTRLAVLNLADTAVSDDCLEGLCAFDKLESLDLQSTRVSDAGLAALQALIQLKILVLTGTLVSDDGLKSLRKIMLNTRIISL